MFDSTIRKQDDLQEELKSNKDNECNNYEHQLQKLEAEIREHIRVKIKIAILFYSKQNKTNAIILFIYK